MQSLFQKDIHQGHLFNQDIYYYPYFTGMLRQSLFNSFFYYGPYVTSLFHYRPYCFYYSNLISIISGEVFYIFLDSSSLLENGSQVDEVHFQLAITLKFSENLKKFLTKYLLGNLTKCVGKSNPQFQNRCKTKSRKAFYVFLYPYILLENGFQAMEVHSQLAITLSFNKNHKSFLNKILKMCWKE